MLKRYRSVRPITYFGWVAYTVLLLMLGLPLIDWLQDLGLRTTLALALVALVTAWLVRRPLRTALLYLVLRR